VKRVAGALCVVVICVFLSGVVSGCGGTRSQPASTPDAPPNTGLPVTGRAQDVVNQANDRTGQLEQTGADQP
jgi:hypothetical protein